MGHQEGHDKLVARAEKIAEIKRAALEPKNVESGFGGINVNIKRDPFDNLDELRFADPEQRGRHRSCAHRAGVLGAWRIRLGHRGGHPQGRERLWSCRLRAAPRLTGLPERVRRIHALGGLPVYTPSRPQPSAPPLPSAPAGAGGFALPTLLDPTLITPAPRRVTRCASISRVVSGTQNVWHGVSVGNVTTYWKAGGSAFTDGSPTFAGPSVTAAALTAYVTASYEIFEDSNLQAQLPA